MSTRSIVNISLPASLNKAVDREVKEYHFASKSEFFRHLLREWMAGRLAGDLEKSRAEYRAGKAIKYTSPQDLWA